MAGSISKDHPSYQDFNSGFDSRQAPLSAIDKNMLAFAIKIMNNPVEETHGQIVRNFGMYPPEFWNRVQRMSGHPDISAREKEKLAYIFPDPSRPGPMGGGAPVRTDGKSFSHGLEW